MSWDDDTDACSILVPVDIVGTPGGIISITAGGVELPEDPNPAYDPATTYAEGARVHSPVTRRVYESAKPGNTGHDPDVLSNQFNAAGVLTWWYDVGPTNRVAMFDGQITTPTVAASPLVISLAPGAFNGFAVFGVEADSYTFVADSGADGDVIYSEPTTSLDSTQPADYYEYFFDRPKPLKQFIRSGIEPYGSARMTFVLTSGSGQVKLGMFAIGDLRPVGIPQRDAMVEPNDFSYIKQDAFGNARIQKRPNATNLSVSAVLPIEDANAVLDTIKEVQGTPVVVVASQARMYEWLLAFGPISAKMTPVPYPDATVQISVKGFI